MQKRDHRPRWRPLLILIAASVWLIGCGTPQPTPGASAPAADAPVAEAPVAAEAPSDVTDLGAEVDPAQVAELNAAGEIAVIDVREDWEYAEGHVPGATLIPLGSLEDRIDEIPEDTPVVLVCRSGNRSGQAFRFLERQGFDNVSNMVGGMLAWEAAGLETEK
jgi:rhodanese-related sulfurtransferase